MAINKMHWCACEVNLAGQGFTVLNFHEFNPASWPEVQVLMQIHGEENVFNIKPVRLSETTPRLEKDRLIAKYNYRDVEKAFPGRVFRMEMLMPGEDTDQVRAADDGVAISGAEPEFAEPKGPTTPPEMGPAVFKPGKPRHAGA
jgi:hypothetical protein